MPKPAHAPAPLARPASGLSIPHLRWTICALLFFASTINYVDRQTLSVLKPHLQSVLHWSESDYGWIVFAFQLAYALMLTVAGLVMDWLGTKLGYALSITWWSIAAMAHALARGARIYGEVGGYCVNSDATDYVLPNAVRQAECIRKAIAHAGLTPAEIDIVNTHATATPQGDIQECLAIGEVFAGCADVNINNTKSFIGHCMGAAGALELAGNLPSFDDLIVHPTINVDELDPQCALSGLVLNQPRTAKRVDAILNNSFGMLGINSALIIIRHRT